VRRCLLLLLALTLLVGGCVGPMRVQPIAPERAADVRERCLECFPREPRRAVHAIHADLPMGKRSSFLGVTVVDPEGRRLRTVGMSVEGLVLFEVLSEGGECSVLRAVPPFDAPEFAANLVDQVALLFLPPTSAAFVAGSAPDGTEVCRWRDGQGRLLELLPGHEGGWRMRRFSVGGGLEVTVRARPPFQHYLAAEMELTARRGLRYALTFELVEGESVTLDEAQFQVPAELTTDEHK
jgi:hypothetical protein